MSERFYVVRDGKEIIALFPNEQRCRFFCQENMAHLTYELEEWERVK